MKDKNIYTQIFRSLIQHKESEVVEFKRACHNYDFDDLGEYFSALSNEANLRGLDFAWMIFGYDEKKGEPVGTDYKSSEGAINKLKQDFSHGTLKRYTRTACFSKSVNIVRFYSEGLFNRTSHFFRPRLCTKNSCYEFYIVGSITHIVQSFAYVRRI